MKKIILSTILLFFSFSNLFAEDRTKELDRLFNELKINNTDLSSRTEQKIWKIWSTHPIDTELSGMLSVGSNFINDNQPMKAIEIFTKVIELDPNWPEAWNKRATVFYMIGEFEKSQKDIDKVLSLEKRHFGALSGQGLVQTALENYQKAIDSYIETHKIYPAMETPLMMIEKLKIKIKKESV